MLKRRDTGYRIVLRCTSASIAALPQYKPAVIHAKNLHLHHVNQDHSGGEMKLCIAACSKYDGSNHARPQSTRPQFSGFALQHDIAGRRVVVCEDQLLPGGHRLQAGLPVLFWCLAYFSPEGDEVVPEIDDGTDCGWRGIQRDPIHVVVDPKRAAVPVPSEPAVGLVAVRIRCIISRS
jgi:hypothetical protein